MEFNPIQDDTAQRIQLQIQQQQQQALAQANANNIGQVKNTNATPQAIDQSKLVQNQQQLTRSMPGITVRGEVNLDINITKIKSESNYFNYQAIKDAKGNPWLVGTDAKSKDFIVSPDFTRAYKLLNPNAVEDKLKSDKPEASKASQEKTTLEQIKNDPKIKEATKKIEDQKNRAIKAAGLAAGTAAWALSKAANNSSVTGIFNIKADEQSEANAENAKASAEEAMRKALTPDFSTKTKEEKLEALTDVVMDHASDPATAISKLVNSGNTQAELTGEAFHYLGQKEVSSAEQAKYFQKMENIASPYVKQMEALEAKNDIQGMENLANDKGYKEVMNYYGNYHQSLQQSGRAMNGIDAEVYRTLINKYK